MKKFLISLLLVVPFNVEANDVSVKINGFNDIQVATKREAFIYDNPISNTSFDTILRNRTKISALFTNRSDNGILYGASVQLQPIVVSGNRYLHNTHKTYIFAETSYGRFEAGSDNSAASKMKIDAESISSGAGGVGGTLYYFTNNTMTTNNGSFVSPTNYKEFFIITTEPLLDYIANTSFNDPEYQRKISYFSPEIKGLQFGISYIPDSTSSIDYEEYPSSRNGSTANEYLIYRKYRNAFSGGITYASSLNKDVSYKISLTGEYSNKYTDIDFGDDRSLNSNHGLRTYAVGGKITWKEFTLAGSYGNWDSRMIKKDNISYVPHVKNPDIITMALAYNQGPVHTSVGFLRSNFRKNILETYSMTASYFIEDGIMPYAEFDWMEMKSNQRFVNSKPRNHANLFIGGLQIRF